MFVNPLTSGVKRSIMRHYKITEDNLRKHVEHRLITAVLMLRDTEGNVTPNNMCIVLDDGIELILQEIGELTLRRLEDNGTDNKKRE